MPKTNYVLPSEGKIMHLAYIIKPFEKTARFQIKLNQIEDIRIKRRSTRNLS